MTVETVQAAVADLIKAEVAATLCPVCGRPNCDAFVCPGCNGHCPFPTQLFEGLKPGEAVSERVSTCGCGMTHKLTRAKGAVSEAPAGVTIDPTWRAKKDAAYREARSKEQAAAIAERTALIESGHCPTCKQAVQ